MTTIVEYAVREKGTQKYLPRPQRRDGRGGSHLEPLDFSDRTAWPESRYNKNMQIRSFTSEAAAKNLLTSWRKGKVYGYYSYDGDEDHELKEQAHRLTMEMEIVKILIILPDPI